MKEFENNALFWQKVDSLFLSGTSGNRNSVTGLIVAADILEKELDVKLLAGCTDEEIEDVLRYLNQTEFQKTIVIRRNSVVPEWAQGDN